MALYEHVFLVRQDMSTQQVDALVEQYKGVITVQGGTVGRVENWGLRPLSYRMRKNRRAYYTLMNIDAPAPAIAELERQLRINEDILRFLTLRVDAHEEGPSAMLARRERDDRGGDRDEDRPKRVRRPRDENAPTAPSEGE